MIPFVPLKLDKVYNLRFGMGVAYEFEKLTGIKVTRIDLGNFSMMEIAQLLWVMMKKENKELTLEAVMDLVDNNTDNLTVAINAVTEAIVAAFPDEEDKNPKNG